MGWSNFWSQSDAGKGKYEVPKPIGVIGEPIGPVGWVAPKDKIGAPIRLIGEAVQKEIDTLKWATKELDLWGYSLLGIVFEEFCVLTFTYIPSETPLFGRFSVIRGGQNYDLLTLHDQSFKASFRLYEQLYYGEREDTFESSGLVKEEAKYLGELAESLKAVGENFRGALMERQARLKLNKAYGIRDPDLEWSAA